MTNIGCGGDQSSPPQPRLQPTITLPPRSSLDTFAIGLSPGPMTLVSNFFSDHYPDIDLRSFSKLFAEALPIHVDENPPTPLVYHDSASHYQQQSRYDKKNQQDLDSQTDKSKPESFVAITKPTNDGYKWRKYGQKQVKASELPRTYYKCTHANCLATKKIGHFLDGEVSDIIYKGQHNHEPPTLHTKAKYGATMYQHTSFVNKPTNVHQQVDHGVPYMVASDAVNLKKRKTNFGCMDRANSPRVMVVETKVVVQTRSEVDILDDGFKWRKYGQKVVKGNTYPRSYYKCAYAGCKVRKHVERVYLDPNDVVTTYEGMHKHDIPVRVKPSNHNDTNLQNRKKDSITTERRAYPVLVTSLKF